MRFFNELLKTNSLLSSKRFIALECLLLLNAVVISNLCGVDVPEIIYYTLSGLILGGSVMTLSKNKTETKSTEIKKTNEK